MGSYDPPDKKEDGRNPAWNGKLQRTTDAVSAGATTGKAGAEAQNDSPGQCNKDPKYRTIAKSWGPERWYPGIRL